MQVLELGKSVQLKVT